jgi:pimeloyl-ACP methyl ester carboxylesterase
MSYESSRTSEILAGFDARIGDLVTQYNPHAQTIVLVPGGMGSQLNRSFKAYANDNSIPLDPYSPVWVSLGLLFGGALDLEIGDDGHDADDHIIIPDGPLRFFLQEFTPYDVTERYFRNAGFNFIVFGYDWRRPLAESVAYFQKFLDKVQQRVKAFTGDDALAEKTTIITHSMGGLVAKLFLNRVLSGGGTVADVRAYCRQMITVAAPFYGTSTHMERYYIGQNPLSALYGPQRTAQVCASMPGPYNLLMLDADTFSDVGAQIGLARYPVRDLTDDSQDADPYAAASYARFPDWVNEKYLKDAKAVQGALAKRLPEAVMKSVFHIRSGLNLGTAVELKWGTPADPKNGQSPIQAVGGAGDGTVPYWSAKLAQTPDSRVYSCMHASDHGELMEHGEVLEAIWRMIDSGETPDAIVTPDVVATAPKATDEQLNQFIADVKSGQITQDDPEYTRPDVWRKMIRELNL